MYLSPAQSDMRQIYTPYVILLVNILSIGRFPPGVLDVWKRQIHPGRGVRANFFDLYSFSRMGLFILLEGKKPKTTKLNRNQTKQIKNRRNKKQTARIKFWKKTECYFEILMNCYC